MNKDDRYTNAWLCQNGVNPIGFESSDITQIKAQKIAHMHLYNNRQYLSEDQIEIFESYLKAMGNKKLRSALTQRQCYEVMNIGKMVNRQLFKAHRQQKR